MNSTSMQMQPLNASPGRGNVRVCSGLGTALVWALTLAVCQNVSASNPEASPEYLNKVRPLLETHCYKCHGAEKQKANLRLDSVKAMMEGGDSGPAVVPGDVDSSNLLTAVCYEDADLQMPPDGKLDEAQIAMLKKWVEGMEG